MIETIDNNYQTNQLIVFVHIYSTIMVKMRISFVQQRFESKSSPEQQIKKYPRHVLHRFFFAVAPNLKNVWKRLRTADQSC